MDADYKIKSFTDLNVWKNGHELVLEIYGITRDFPKEEVYGITSQIRRCTVSFTSNIAEGFSRRSGKEKMQFYYMALASLTELQNQLLIVKDLGYITEDKFNKLASETISLSKMTNGLIKSANSKPIIHNTKH